MRILSGIQTSGVLHIANYFGMMRPAIALQAEGEALYFIADYHALTSVRDPEALRTNSRRVALDFLACGLDPERATLFRHSDVPQVTELAWILSTVAPMGLLERAHSYKDKLARGVPATETVPGIDGQKMSKSYGNNIDIFGDEKETRKRVMSIVTDSTPIEASKDPERSTIVQLYSLFGSKDELANMKEQFKKGGTGYGDFKKELFEKLWGYFATMRQRREEILRDKSYIDDVLTKGAKRANEIADQVMHRVRKAVGLR